MSAVVLGLAASLSHFAYGLSRGAEIVGLFNPVNESVWEHLKFMFFPNILWWATVFLLLGERKGLDLRRWVSGAAASAVSAVLCTLFLFYTYTSALGAESVGADIALVFVSYFIALNVGVHFYRYSKAQDAGAAVSAVVIILIALAFVLFTKYPPELPIFQDPLTGTYGFPEI